MTGLRLSDEDSEVFAKYLKRIFFGDRSDILVHAIDSQAYDLMPHPSDEELIEAVHTYKDLYLLSEMLQDHTTQNGMVNAFLQEMSKEKGTSSNNSVARSLILSQEIYLKTPPKNNLRRLLADLYVHVWFPAEERLLSSDMQDPPHNPPDAFAEVAKAFGRQIWELEDTLGEAGSALVYAKGGMTEENEIREWYH